MSDDLDRQLRDRARAARDASRPGDADVEQTLADITSGAQLTRLRPVAGRPDRRRWIAFAGAAAAVAVFAAGAVWLLGGDDDRVRSVDPTVPATVVSTSPPSSLSEVVTNPPTPSSESVTTSTVASPPSTEQAVPPPTDPPATTPPSTAPTTVTTVPPTLPPDPNAAAVLDGLYYEYAGFRNSCDAEGRCTHVRFDPYGAPVTYDLATRTVARQTRDAGTTVQFTLPAEYGEAAFMAAGPDRVAYFSVPTDDIDFADAVAISLAAEDAGREILRIPGGGYGPGDYDLVPTPEGLAVVGWYGQGWHPPADAHVAIEWIDRSGAPIISPQPIVEVDFYSHDVRIEDRTWSVGALPVEVHASMPSALLPTFDGGFVAAWAGSSDDLRIVVVRGWADGTVAHWVSPVGWDKVSMTVDPTGHLLVANGSFFARAELWPARPADYWDGALDEGAQAGEPLNVHLDQNDPWWEHAGLVEFANAVVGPLNSPAERRSIEVLDAEDLVVAVTTEGFLDDSVAGGRTVLDVASTPEGLRLESVEHTHACQPNRGHQDFTDDLCN